MRVAVTGASGFVGRAVVRALADAGIEVLATSRRPCRGVAWHGWDLTAGVWRGAPPVDAVVHAAAAVDDGLGWTEQRRTTVAGTDAVLRTWPGARVVLISSASVYPVFTTDLGETVPPTRWPSSAYVRAKIAQEDMVMARGGTIVLRPHAVHGPGDTTLLPRFARARRGGWLVVPGPKDGLIHLTAVETLATAVVAAVMRPEVTGPVNVADAEAVRLEWLVTELARVNQWRERPVHLPVALAWSAGVLGDAAGVLARTTRVAATPTLSRYTVSHVATSRVLRLGRLRSELGVAPAPTDVSDWCP